MEIVAETIFQVALHYLEGTFGTSGDLETEGPAQEDEEYPMSY